MLHVPDFIVKKIEKIITNFMWNNNRNCIINDIENGGINIVDVRSKINSLKASWVIKWEGYPRWVPVADVFLKHVGLDFELCLQMNLKSNILNSA